MQILAGSPTLRIRPAAPPRIIGAAVLCLSAAVIATGCNDGKQPQMVRPVVIQLPPGASAGDEGIKLRDLSTPPPLPPEVMAAAPRAPQRLIVKVLAFDRDPDPLAIGIDMLDPIRGDPRLTQMWRDNGLCIGSIHRVRLPLLLGNLPKPLHGNVTTLFSAQVDNPVTLIDKLRGRQRVRVVEVDGSSSNRRFYNGEHRLLIKVLPPDPRAGGPTRLEVVPHFHSRTRSLLARDPQETVKDGYSFDHLSLREPIADDEVWVITADPEATPPETTEGEGPEPRSAQAISLGEAMLSGEYQGRPVRLVVLISLEPAARRP